MLRWMSRSAWLPCLFAVAPSHGPESVGRARVSVTRPGLTVHRPVDGCPRGGRSLAVGKRLRPIVGCEPATPYSSGSSHAR